MVLPANLASAKCIAVFVLVFIYLFFCFVLFDCLFNWSTEMAVLT